MYILVATKIDKKLIIGNYPTEAMTQRSQELKWSSWLYSVEKPYPYPCKKLDVSHPSDVKLRKLREH